MNPSRPSFVCTSCAKSLRNAIQPQATRGVTTVSPRSNGGRNNFDPEPPEELPRWKQTPARMTMPVRLRPQPKQPLWSVNADDEALNEVYDNFLSRVGNKRGRDLLSEQVKWLAVTHKSFDHGRQGFNDRLAYLGKRIVDLQTSLALLSAPSPPMHLPENDVYRHPALEGLENITQFSKVQVLDKSRLATLAAQYGLDKVVRWKPRRSDDLKGSGVDLIMAHTIYSIVGAVAMQQGGEIAARTARERILQPLGLR